MTSKRMRQVRSSWLWVPAMGLSSLLVACTLDFDLPKSSDAAPVVVDAAPTVDAAEDPGFTACSTPYASVSTNILKTGGFEVDREGWSNTAEFDRDTSQSRMGIASMHTALDGGTNVANKVYAVQANTVYTISGWVKTAGVTNAGCRVRVRWLDMLGETLSTDSTAYLTGTSDWTLAQSTHTSDSLTTNARVSIECNAGAGEAWFDHIWFLPGNGPICGNLNCELDENCLADCGGEAAPGAIFMDGFDADAIAEVWLSTIAGVWANDTSAANQSTADAEAYATPTNDLGASDYRIGAEMTRFSSGPGSMGLSLRGSTTAPGYQCKWQPETATLSILGNEPLASVTLSELLSDDNYSADAPFAMQAEVVGNQIQCCLHGYPDAKLTASDATFASGVPGMVSDELAVDFDSFTVVVP